MVDGWGADPLDDADEPTGDEAEGLIYLLERQQELLTAVATGTSITQAYTDIYRRRRRSIRKGLLARGLDDPFPWSDLYLWWARAKDFGTYQERRTLLSSGAEPVIEQLERQNQALADWSGAPDEGSWGSLEARLSGLKKEYEQAEDLDSWQDVGRRAREIMIDAANLVYDPSMAGKEEPPKKGDAKNRLAQYLRQRVPEESHADLRKLVQATWDLANTIAHSGSVTQAEAFAVAQATVVLVRTLAQLEAEG